MAPKRLSTVPNIVAVCFFRLSIVESMLFSKTSASHFLLSLLFRVGIHRQKYFVKSNR
jgi:hypothetical protein